MRMFLVAAGALALMAGTAAADVFDLPGGELTIKLPSGFHAGEDELVSPSNTGFVGRRMTGDCASILRSVDGTIEPAAGAPPTWSNERSRGGNEYLYCRQIDAQHALLLSASANDEAAVMQDLPTVMRAIDDALAATAPAPPPPGSTTTIASFTFRGVDGSVLLPAARYKAIDGGAMTIDGSTAVITELADGTCDAWLASQRADPQVRIEPADGLDGSWSTSRVVTGPHEYIYCRMRGGQHLGMGVKTVDDRLLAGVLPEITLAIETAVPSYGEPSGSGGNSSTTATSGGGSTESTYHPPEEPHPPEAIQAVRIALAGGQVSADGGDSSTFVALRMRMSPRYVLEDYATEGYVTGVEMTGGGAGSAFVGDVAWSNGYGFGGENVVLAPIFVIGADRLGGGFDPIYGLYAGFGGYLRLGSGSTALEGEAITTWSTGTDELRAQASLLTHVGARVLAIGGFYQRWDGAGTLIGAQIGLTP